VRPFVADTFVMRIRVAPVDGAAVYFWNDNNNKMLEEQYITYRCSEQK